MPENKVFKKRVMIDAKVVIEPRCDMMQPTKTIEGQAAQLDRWAKELDDIFGDRPEFGVNSVRVERVYENQCSGCGHKWEDVFDEEDGLYCCGWCGAVMEVVR